MPLTGKYAALGEQVNNGYQVGVKMFNDQGGVMVKSANARMPLEITVLDDASDPNQTVQRLETFNSQNVDVYFGGAGSDLHAAAAAVAEKNKIAYLGVAFGLLSIHQQGYKYLFSPFPKSPAMAKTVFDIMDSLDPKPTKVGLLVEKTDLGSESEALWKKEATARGYTVAVDVQYAPGAADYSSQVQQAKQAGVDALLAVPAPPDGIAIVKQLKELDVNPKLLHMIRASDNSSWAQALGKDGDYNIYCNGWSTDVKFPGNAELLQAYQQQFNKPAEGLVGTAYLMVQVLVDAVGRVATYSRDAIRDAISATKLETSVLGPVSFNADGTVNMVTIFGQWQNQKQVGVWPKDNVGGTVAYPAKPVNER
ncbi:MAG: amino acid ABC transporter substrate-binding protein [Chloroflexota bacterium]|nr:amino acid ABC transporter substrate-binding protein [Chloroflexota bacterium]